MKKKKEQPRAEEQSQDLDLEIVSLRRAVAECEVAKNRFEIENGDLLRELKQARASLDLKDQRLADLEAHSETLVMALKSKADEADDIRRELESTQAGLVEKSDTIEGLVERLR